MSEETAILSDYTSRLERCKSHSVVNGTLDSEMQTPVKQHGPTSSYTKHDNPLLFHENDGEFHETICHICSQNFAHFRALQHHHHASHAVTVLPKGNSTRRIVEIMFKTSWLKSGIHCRRIERILKVNNLKSTVARFEEYREIVMSKASKLSKTHPRCLADGNEVLRFHGTTIMCSLGANGLCSLCTFEGCSVCKIIRTGFFSTEIKGRGIFTTASSGRANDSIEYMYEDEIVFPVKRAILVCRVIAGRVHKPLDKHEAFPVPVAFDSVGDSSSLEELVVFNSRAVLPCFLVVYS
eukprot:Gb_30270 [translate_table: standard]